MYEFIDTHGDEEQFKKFLSDFAKLTKEHLAGWKNTDILIKDTEDKRSWNTLGFFDGFPPHVTLFDPVQKYNQEMEKRRNLRERSMELSPHLLELAFNLGVNSALYPPNPFLLPGHEHGGRIVLERVAWDGASLFYNSVTPELQTKLLNLALWESIPDLSSSLNYGSAYSPVERILSQHINDISLDQVREGIDKLRRRDRSLKLPGGELPRLYSEGGLSLSLRAIRNYGLLLEKLKPTGILNSEEFEFFAQPYREVLEEKSEFGDNVIDPKYAVDI